MALAIDPRSGFAAHDRYVRELSRAYNDGFEIYDPGFALSKDPNAYFKIRRDWTVEEAFTYRQNLVAGRNVIFEPASSRKPDVFASTVQEEIWQRIPNRRIFLRNQTESILRGAAWSWPNITLQVLPLVDGVPRQWAIPIEMVEMNHLRVISRAKKGIDGRVGTEMMIWDLDQEKWVPFTEREFYTSTIYNQKEETLNNGNGLINALWYIWWGKTLLWREFMGLGERAGRGFVVASIDGRVPGAKSHNNTKLRDDFINNIEKHMARGVLAHDSRHKIEVLKGFGEGAEIILKGLEYCDKAQRGILLAAQLPTAGSEGGSQALGKIQENSTEALVQFDREVLGDSVSDSLGQLLWKLNRVPIMEAGKAAGYDMSFAQPGKLVVVQEKYTDPVREAQINQLALNSGADLKEDEFYKSIGRTVPVEGDKVIKGQKLPMPGANPAADTPENPFAQGFKAKYHPLDDSEEARVERVDRILEQARAFQRNPETIPEDPALAK